MKEGDKYYYNGRLVVVVHTTTKLTQLGRVEVCDVLTTGKLVNPYYVNINELLLEKLVDLYNGKQAQRDGEKLLSFLSHQPTKTDNKNIRGK